jgi:hypothetical protein
LKRWHHYLCVSPLSYCVLQLTLAMTRQRLPQYNPEAMRRRFGNRRYVSWWNSGLSLLQKTSATFALLRTLIFVSLIALMLYYIPFTNIWALIKVLATIVYHIGQFVITFCSKAEAMLESLGNATSPKEAYKAVKQSLWRAEVTVSDIYGSIVHGIVPDHLHVGQRHPKVEETAEPYNINNFWYQLGAGFISTCYLSTVEPCPWVSNMA